MTLPRPWRRLEYDPPLPSWRDQLTQRTPAGSVIKTYAIYPEPFWRNDGLNGQAVSDTGPVKVTFDNSPPSGRPGVLLGFIEGREARTWARRTQAERREAVIGCFVRYFGQAAARPGQYVERDWMAEEFTRGCYGAHFAPGVWTSYGEAWRAPAGRIHWAGASVPEVERLYGGRRPQRRSRRGIGLAPRRLPGPGLRQSCSKYCNAADVTSVADEVPCVARDVKEHGDTR